jgi:hypothetical protein
MEYSDILNDERIPNYEDSINKPVLTQGFQPFSLDNDVLEDEKERPVYLSNEQTEVMTVGQYLSMLLLQLIPVVGLIFCVLWATNKSDSSPKRQIAKAILIFDLIVYSIVTICLLL